VFEIPGLVVYGGSLFVLTTEQNQKINSEGETSYPSSAQAKHIFVSVIWRLVTVQIGVLLHPTASSSTSNRKFTAPSSDRGSTHPLVTGLLKLLSSYDWTSDLEARSQNVQCVCIEPVTAGLHRPQANELSREETDTTDRSVNIHVCKVYMPKLHGT